MNSFNMEFLKTYLRNLIIIAGVIFSSSILYACSDEPDNISDEKKNVTDGGDADEGGSGDDNTTDGNILIVYFSRTGYNYPNQWLDIGHTARVAGFIAELTGGDSFELLPKYLIPTITSKRYQSRVRNLIITVALNSKERLLISRITTSYL